MREIKSITVVTNQGVSTYSIGDKVNGLSIDHIVACGIEYSDSLHIGFRCMGENPTDYIVEIWNAPVVVEYYESEVRT